MRTDGVSGGGQEISGEGDAAASDAKNLVAVPEPASAELSEAAWEGLQHDTAATVIESRISESPIEAAQELQAYAQELQEELDWLYDVERIYLELLEDPTLSLSTYLALEIDLLIVQSEILFVELELGMVELEQWLLEVIDVLDSLLAYFDLLELVQKSEAEAAEKKRAADQEAKQASFRATLLNHQTRRSAMALEQQHQSLDARGMLASAVLSEDQSREVIAWGQQHRALLENIKQAPTEEGFTAVYCVLKELAVDRSKWQALRGADPTSDIRTAPG